MAHLQTIHLAQTPPSTEVHVALYTDVKNAAFLRAQLLAGNEEFQYAFLDASMLVSTNHVQAAVFRAINDASCSRLKTRNLHSEIVYALSPNNNIAESFRRFGVQDTTTSLVVVKVTSSPLTSSSQSSDTLPSPSDASAKVQAHLVSAVEGTSIPFTDETLLPLTDVARVKKIYKLNVGGGGKGGVVANGDVSERKKLEVDVLGVMALRGAN